MRAALKTQIVDIGTRVQDGQEYMQAVFSAAKVGLCLLDAEGAVLAVNEMGKALMQVDEHNVVGRQFGDAFCCENSLEKGCGHGKNCRHCPVRRNVEAALADDTFNSEFSMQMKQAQSEDRLWLNMGISQTGRERDKKLIVTMVDASARRQYEKQLEQAKRAAEESDRSKMRFMSIMGHEIRTPLNGIIGMLDLVGQEPLSPKQQQCLQNVRSSTDDLLCILNDILDFAKLENGQMKLERADFDLQETLERMADIYRQLATAKGLRFVVPQYANLPRLVCGDGLRIRQVLHNILTNALNFTEKGKITLAVYRSERKGRPTLEFSVEDTGSGMDEHIKDKIFHPFAQADSRITRKIGGKGLGLTISRELVELMGGGMSMDTELERGTCVSFWIPLQEADGAAKVGKRIILRPQTQKAEKILAAAERDDRLGE
jgi:signal transduction histidine kinase